MNTTRRNVLKNVFLLPKVAGRKKNQPEFYKPPYDLPLLDSPALLRGIARIGYCFSIILEG